MYSVQVRVTREGKGIGNITLHQWHSDYAKRSGYTSNALQFFTYTEALDYANDLTKHWTSIKGWIIVDNAAGVVVKLHHGKENGTDPIEQ